MNKLSKLSLFSFLILTNLLLVSCGDDEVIAPPIPEYLKKGNFFDCSSPGETFLSFDSIKTIKSNGAYHIYNEGDNLHLSEDANSQTSTLIKTFENYFAGPHGFDFIENDVVICDNEGIHLYETTTNNISLLADVPCRKMVVNNGYIYFATNSIGEWSLDLVYRYSMDTGNYITFVTEEQSNMSSEYLLDFKFDAQGNLYRRGSDDRIYVHDPAGNYLEVISQFISSSIPFNGRTKYLFDGEDMIFLTLDNDEGFEIIKRQGEQLISLLKIDRDTDDAQEELFHKNGLGDVLLRDGKLYLGVYNSLFQDAYGLHVFDVTSDTKLEPTDYYILEEEGRTSQSVSTIVEIDNGDIVYLSDGIAYKVSCN